MICARCDFAILPGDTSTRVDKFSDSAAGVPLDLHESCPRNTTEARNRLRAHERRTTDRH